MLRLPVRTLFTLAFLMGTTALAADPLGHAENVIVVTLDGTRRQEVFGGVDKTLVVEKKNGAVDAVMLRNKYFKSTPEEQRQILMPFFWDTLAKQGQIFGDRSVNCIAAIANPHRFSYPGYSEMSVGYVEPKIDSNGPTLNPNPTVYEYLNQQPAFKDKVAVFGAWDRINEVINPKRSGVYINAGWRPILPFRDQPLGEREQLLNEMRLTLTRDAADEVPDCFVFTAAVDHFKANHPRVLWVSFGEPDHWGHANRYDRYLEAVTRCDDYIRQLWELAQATRGYAGKTAMVITTDHGRGLTLTDWTSHGSKIEGAQDIWMAVIGPDTPALGVRKDCTVSQGQIAATIANLVGQDYRATEPKAAAPLPDAIK